jgi:DNA-binding transcriptional LysR family regulator
MSTVPIDEQRTHSILVLPHVANGQLIRVLENWCPPFTGYHLYYPSRQYPSPAFAILVQALRFR